MNNRDIQTTKPDRYEMGKEEGMEAGRAEGRIEGEKDGKISTLLELSKDGLISLTDAALRAGMTKENFAALLK